MQVVITVGYSLMAIAYLFNCDEALIYLIENIAPDAFLLQLCIDIRERGCCSDRWWGFQD
jgi:hypothetical protein